MTARWLLLGLLGAHLALAPALRITVEIERRPTDATAAPTAGQGAETDTPVGSENRQTAPNQKENAPQYVAVLRVVMKPVARRSRLHEWEFDAGWDGETDDDDDFTRDVAQSADSIGPGGPAGRDSWAAIRFQRCSPWRVATPTRTNHDCASRAVYPAGRTLGRTLVCAGLLDLPPPATPGSV